MPQEWAQGLLGGVLIGISVSIMLLFNGRVTGISGIISGMLNPQKRDIFWRAAFVAGMLVGGGILYVSLPESFRYTLETPVWSVVVAGLLVGFGTVMGSGCTSGHGVCGVSRLSLRSIVATSVFILAGIISVVAFKTIGVLQ